MIEHDLAARREAEREQLDRLGDGFGLADLVATPAAAWRARFLGEFFYGATPAEAEAKAREFARDVGRDAVEQLDAGDLALSAL